MIRPTMIATLIYRGLYPTFESWSAHYGKSYPSLTEISHRAWIYHNNLEYIHKHNQANYTWTMGVNKFADFTSDEFTMFTESTPIFTTGILSIPDESSFQFYSEGVMPAICDLQFNNSDLISDSGTLNGQNFYKVKNSWGVDWGMDGHILIHCNESVNSSG